MANNPNNKENLISLADRPLEERQAIGRKGGLTPSPKRALAQQIRRLSKKGLTDESAKYLFDLMTDPEISALDVRMYLEDIKKSIRDTNKPMTKIMLAKTFIDWHKSTHGEKHTNTNMNMNINLDFEKWKEEMLKDD